MRNYTKIYEEKLERQKKAIAIMGRLPEWIDRLKSREIDRLSEARFCKRYDINRHSFNRLKRGNYPAIPKEETLEPILKAFRAEGIEC